MQTELITLEDTNDSLTVHNVDDGGVVVVIESNSGEFTDRAVRLTDTQVLRLVNMLIGQKVTVTNQVDNEAGQIVGWLARIQWDDGAIHISDVNDCIVAAHV